QIDVGGVRADESLRVGTGGQLVQTIGVDELEEVAADHRAALHGVERNRRALALGPQGGADTEGGLSPEAHRGYWKGNTIGRCRHTDKLGSWCSKVSTGRERRPRRGCSPRPSRTAA